MLFVDTLSRYQGVFYLYTGVAVYSGISDPEGAANGYAGIGSIYTNLTSGAVFKKTTAFALNTGWVELAGGGGGAGTVTDFTAGNLSPLFTSSVATSTTTPALTFAQVSQLQNLFFASPDGSSGNPVFRAMVAADVPNLPFSKITTGIVPVAQGGTGQDLSAVATGEVLIGTAPGVFGVAQLVPGNAGEVPFNGGGGLFDASDEFHYDEPTATLRLGASGGNSGVLNLQSAANDNVTIGVNAPVSQNILLPDALPTDNTRFLKVGSVAGVDVQLEYAVPASGAAVANPTGIIGLSTVNGVAATAIRSDGSPALSQAIAPTWTQDHIWSGSSANRVAVGLNGNTNPAFRIVTNVASQATGIEVTGRAAAAGVDISVISGGTNESLRLVPKGTGSVIFPAGAAATPALISTVDADTGIYFVSDGFGNTVNVSINSQRSYIFGATFYSNTPILIGSDDSYGFGSNTTIGTAADTRTVRAAAGVIRASDGGTGIGSLLIAQNGVTAQGNLHVEPTATGTRPIYTNSPSGATANLIEQQVNTSGRFTVSVTGKITNNQNGVAAVRTCGQYVADVTDHNNTGTSPTDLFTNTLPANLLGTNLDCLAASFTLTTASNANGKQISVVFGSTTIFDTGAQAFNGNQIQIECKIYRVSATVQRCVVYGWDSGGLIATLASAVTYTDATEDLTTALIIKTVGDGGATNDITNKMALIVINPN